MLHSSEECDAFKTLSITQHDLIENPEIVTVLRCLIIRKTDPDKFQQLFNLEPHLEKRRDTEIWQRNHIVIEAILEKLKVLDSEDLKNETAQKISGILDINTFDVRQKNHVEENLRGLYPTAALMAHDCLSNVHLSIDRDFVLYGRACVDIDKKQPIFFNYANVLQGNSERKMRLFEGKFFECKCLRCEDSTELGTEMSSLKCPTCRKGLLRPSNWQCNFCLKHFSESMVKMTLIECQRRTAAIIKPTIHIFEDFLSKITSTFHKNHYLILDIEQKLVRLYTESPPTENNLIRKIELCKKLLNVYEKIEPGISRIQAMVLYELYTGFVLLSEKRRQSRNEYLLQAKNALKKSVQFLLYEPMNSPEGELAQNAIKQLKELRLHCRNMSIV